MVAYEISPDAISVLFRREGWYTYNYASARVTTVERMKNLAIRGYELCSFIQCHARKLFE